MPEPTPLWTPTPERQLSSQLHRFMGQQGFASYDDLWRWSADPDAGGAFWEAVAADNGVELAAEPGRALVRDDTSVTGSRFFPDATCNYAQVALRRRDGGTALIARDDARGETTMAWGELADLVGSIEAGLRSAGVERGDVVAGYLPNVAETLACMLATAALGATWTCCAPEMGADGVIDRLRQADPAVLIAVDGYRYGERTRDVRDDAAAVRAALPSLRRSFMLALCGLERPRGFNDFADLTAEPAQPVFEAVAFEHPLYILYSSGTTGAPKAIVHGHGGITLEHLKALRYHFDLSADDRFFWYTTTGWMMWNFCVSGLLVGATVALHDGDPTAGRRDRLFEFMADYRITCGGVGAAYLVACEKAGLRPRDDLDLGMLRTLGATGSPLPARAAAWVYEAVTNDVLVMSYSGGTDVCTGFVGGSPLHPVWPGEISCRCLGVAADVFDEAGRSVVGEEGELVVTAPMPSMPVGFLRDPGGSRYRETYFAKWPGVWVHGDRATLTDRGTLVITGRSDGTLNRGGVRMGTAEFYAVVETIPGVHDSLVVHLEDPDGGPGELWCFVVAPGEDPAALAEVVRAEVRARLSPRHVPDRVVVVHDVPRTLTGKKLEVPVKRILLGEEIENVVVISSVSNPESLEAFRQLARQRGQ